MQGNVRTRARSADVAEISTTDTNAAQAEPQRMSWQALLPVWATVFTGMLWLASVRPFISTIADDLGTSVSLIGQVTTAAMLTMAIVGLFSGPLSEHYGYRRTIVTGLTLFAGSAVLISASTSFIMVIIGGVLGGLAASMTYGIAFAVVMNQFSGDLRRSAMGYTQAVASSATVLTPPLLAGIAALLLWRGSFGVVAVASVVAAILAFKGLPVDPPITGRRAAALAILRAYHPLFSSPVMVRLYGATALRAMVGLGIPAYMGAFYADRFGFSLQEIGIAAMVEGIGLVAGSAFAGSPWCRRDGRKVFSFGMVVVGLGWVVVLSGQLNPLLTVAISTTMIFTAGLAFTTITHMLAEETPSGPATTMVLNMSMVGFGGAFGGVYGGLVLQFADYQWLGVAVLPFALATSYLVWRKDAPAVGMARLRTATQFLR